MAYIPPTYTTTIPNTAAGKSGNNYSNVTITTGAGLTYSTGTTATWAPTKAKVQITEEDIVIQGQSLAKTILDLQERLAIFIQNPEIEKEFEQLAKLRRQYIELEKELKEKIKAWETLKKTD